MSYWTPGPCQVMMFCSYQDLGCEDTGAFHIPFDKTWQSQTESTASSTATPSKLTMAQEKTRASKGKV